MDHASGNPRRNEARSRSSQEVSPHRARDRHVTTWGEQLDQYNERTDQQASTSIKEALESDSTDQFFQTHFLSLIEEQALSQSEQAQLVKINRKTPLSEIPEVLRMAFTIARGHAILEKVNSLSDEVIDKEELFNNLYKNEMQKTKKDKKYFKVSTILKEEKFPSYINYINIEYGIIESHVNMGRGAPLPNSEILYNQLLFVLRDQKIDPSKFSLTRVIQKNIVNQETLDTLRCCVRNLTKTDRQSASNSTYQFAKGSDGYYAILGTPNVYGILYLLKQHPSFFGKKEITSIEVQKHDNSRLNPILHIGEREGTD